MSKRRRALVPVLVLLLGGVAVAAAIVRPWAERGADGRYDTRVADPALATQRPRVLFDHGHRNVHSASGRYRPFAKLIGSDGCRVRQVTGTFTPALLRDADMLVVVNAKGPEAKQEAAAFTPEECDAVRDWVHDGGALLLVADHHPCGEAASPLAQRFGVDMSGGWCDDSTSARPGSGDPGQILFTRASGRLADHAITRGGGAALNTVETFTGQSLLGPPEATPILVLAATAVDRIPVASTTESHGTRHVTTFQTEDRSAAGRCQGLALPFGKGRVVVLGEAAMLTAQVQRGLKFGMNAPGNENRVFCLAVVRWLAGATSE